jgi:hypothetical protein
MLGGPGQTRVHPTAYSRTRAGRAASRFGWQVTGPLSDPTRSAGTPWSRRRSVPGRKAGTLGTDRRGPPFGADARPSRGKSEGVRRAGFNVVTQTLQGWGRASCPLSLVATSGSGPPCNAPGGRAGPQSWGRRLRSNGIIRRCPTHLSRGARSRATISAIGSKRPPG